MRAGRAGRGDRIVHALDPEGRGQAGGNGRGHALGHPERADALGAAGLADDVVGLEERLGRWPTRADDDPGAFVRDVGLRQPRVLHRLVHGDEGIGRAIPHEAQVALVDVVFQHDVRRAMDAAAEAMLGIVGGEDDAGLAGAKAGLDLGGRVADGRDDPDPGDDDAAHGASLGNLGSVYGRGERGARRLGSDGRHPTGRPVRTARSGAEEGRGADGCRRKMRRRGCHPCCGAEGWASPATDLAPDERA